MSHPPPLAPLLSNSDSPVPANLPSVERSRLPFEPSHDAAPESRDAQQAAIVALQAERDRALDTGVELCAFPADVVTSVDDVALLQAVWALQE